MSISLNKSPEKGVVYQALDSRRKAETTREEKNLVAEGMVQTIVDELCTLTATVANGIKK